MLGLLKARKGGEKKKKEARQRPKNQFPPL
jgi:hypothetical protein